MKKVLLLLALVLCFALFAAAQAQDPSSQGQSSNPAASSSQATAPDQGAAKTDTGMKEKSMKGCLSGPDASGNYTLTHGKKTITVAANDQLKEHVGHEVQLKGTKDASGNFTVDSVKHISDSCPASAASGHQHEKGTPTSTENPK